MVEQLERNGVYLMDPSRTSPDIASNVQLILGTRINPSTINKMKSGETNGTFLKRRFEAASLLKEPNGARKKDAYYSHFLQTAEIVFEYSKVEQPINVMTLLAKELHVSPTRVRSVWNAMRTEIVLESLVPSETISAPFLDAANAYFVDTSGHKDRSLTRLQKNWDGKTLADFYKHYFSSSTSHLLRGWRDYELPVLQLFYKKRIDEGSPLSVLDRLVLEGTKYYGHQGYEIASIRKSTSVAYNKGTTTAHLNALIRR